jgi:triosephosphate isomerase
MKRRIVAGNWKMNLVSDEVNELIKAIENADQPDGVELMVFPTSLFIAQVAQKTDKVVVGVQNLCHEASGAFTGEQSISQVKSVGAECTLIGHSERRELFNETNSLLKKKVDACLTNKLKFIFCCGEPLNIRKTGREADFIKQQLEESLFHLTKDQMKSVVIAYEPIWAIGTGETATSDQAESMHADIRSWIAEKYDEDTANNVAILYGGSCKPDNAKELFSCPNVDGGLIGGASLKAESFLAIAKAFE